MATPVVKCKLSNQEEFKITSVEDIEEVFTQNNIIPHYREHLKHVNTCLLMFEELENNRTWGEWFTDWNYGARNEINGPRLIDNLKKLKKELLEGLTQYTKLLSQKEKLKNYIREFIVSKSDLDITYEKFELDTYFKWGVDSVEYASTVLRELVNKITIQCRELTDTVNELSKFVIGTDVAVIGAGVGVGAVAGGLLYGIHLVAKSYGEKRGVKYQRVKAISDALDTDFLSKIKTYHEDLNTIFINMENIRKNEEPMILQAYKLYTKSKDESFKELKEEGIDDNLCEKTSKKIAIKDVGSYLIHKFGCSKQEAEELCKEIQKY